MLWNISATISIVAFSLELVAFLLELLRPVRRSSATVTSTASSSKMTMSPTVMASFARRLHLRLHLRRVVRHSRPAGEGGVGCRREVEPA